MEEKPTEIRTGTVSQINNYIMRILDNNKILRDVNVKGEISNYKRHSSGHLYLTLKDEGGVLRAVMFRGNAHYLNFEPCDGMKVIARGRVGVYEAGGSYQLYISQMTPDGVGSLHEQFERLKRELQKEGLFENQYKRPIPKFPKRVGVITAIGGAALRDIINVMTRRFPMTEIVIYPAQVQGAGAAQTIVDGIEYFNEKNKVDTLIVGRGGGSLEDLWAFNEEIVARAIFSSRIPIISAVGHEVDFTISDFVADLRAPTPSAAAELAVPNHNELTECLISIWLRLIHGTQNIIKQRKLWLNRTRLKTPMQRIEERAQRLDNLSRRIEISYKYRLIDKKTELKRLDTAMKNGYKTNLLNQQRRFANCVSKLDALSPLKVLTRGYAIPLKDKRVVRGVNDVNIGDSINLKVNDGFIDCVVKGVSK